MPTDKKVLGFGNRWYASAARAAMPFQLTSDHTIRLISPAYFLATKLEAFDGRGGGDYLTSHDIEDIVSVIDGRASLPADIATADSALRQYLSARFQTLRDTPDFIDAVSGHLPPDEASQERSSLVLQRIRELIDHANQGI